MKAYLLCIDSAIYIRISIMDSGIKKGKVPKEPLNVDPLLYPFAVK